VTRSCVKPSGSPVCCIASWRSYLTLQRWLVSADQVPGNPVFIPATRGFVPKRARPATDAANLSGMRLLDQLAQCERPFIVRNTISGQLTTLSGARELGAEVRQCQLRYVLDDELTRLCTALAYSKGARTLDCADLLHVPAQSVWVEWCEAPWQRELLQFGFPSPSEGVDLPGRRGALIRASRDGRRGVIRVGWMVGPVEQEPVVSPMEAYFDFDTEEGAAPEPPEDYELTRHEHRVADRSAAGADILSRCFRFRLQRSWAQYYTESPLTAGARVALDRHNLSQLAPAIPVILAFFLLLAARGGLPVHHAPLERLNRARAAAKKRPLLDHVAVSAPIFKSDQPSRQDDDLYVGRRRPRLHHVRGHLVRRGNQLFWRVPHLRGHATFGAVRGRTVTWTFNSEAEHG
jgi:hypothetical protein